MAPSTALLFAICNMVSAIILDGMEISTLSRVPYTISGGVKGDKYLLPFNINAFVENPEEIEQINVRLKGKQANFVTVRVAINELPNSENELCFNRTVWTMPECICPFLTTQDNADTDIYILIEATFNFNQVNVTLELKESQMDGVASTAGTDVGGIRIIDKSEKTLISTTNPDNDNANADAIFIDHFVRKHLEDNHLQSGLFRTGIKMEFVLAWFVVTSILLILWIMSCRTAYTLKKKSDAEYDIQQIYL